MGTTSSDASSTGTITVTKETLVADIEGDVTGDVTGNVTVNGLLKMPSNTAGKVLVGDGTSYEEVAISGDVSLASSGAVTISANAVEGSMLNDNVISGQTALTSDLARHASKKALFSAGISADQVDIIVLATTTPDETFPATATTLQAQLGMTKGVAFDIQAVCAGFVFAINIAKSMMLANNYNKALIIGSEVFSNILDWKDRSTCVLFGDGAGAIVLEKTNAPGWGILTSNIHSDGDFIDILYTDGGPGTTGLVGKVRMNGKEVFKHAVEKLSACTLEALEEVNFAIDDVDFFIPHQANERIIDTLAKKLKITESKIIKTVSIHANTSAASIPLAMHKAYEDGLIKNGSVILVQAIGSGLSWGASIIKFGKPRA